MTQDGTQNETGGSINVVRDEDWPIGEQLLIAVLTCCIHGRYPRVLRIIDTEIASSYDLLRAAALS